MQSFAVFLRGVCRKGFQPASRAGESGATVKGRTILRSIRPVIGGATLITEAVGLDRDRWGRPTALAWG